MLCNPRLRAVFLEAVSRVVECQDEETLLWSIVSLRKKKMLPSVLK
jgi:hypothetical protein